MNKSIKQNFSIDDVINITTENKEYDINITFQINTFMAQFIFQDYKETFGIQKNPHIEIANDISYYIISLIQSKFPLVLVRTLVYKYNGIEINLDGSDGVKIIDIQFGKNYYEKNNKLPFH